MIRMETIPMSRMLPPRGSVTGVGHAQDTHCPLSELKECQKLFAKWRSEVERARRHTGAEQTNLEEILAGVASVQETTNVVVILAEETVKHHQDFCEKVAKTLRTAASRPNGELTRDEDIVRAGQDVSRSFAEFSDHIDVLHGALQKLATTLQKPATSEETATTQTEGHKHHYHLIPHPHLHFPHLHQIAETMKNRDVIVSILNTSIKVIFAVMALLVAMHPAVHHVLAVLVPLEDSVEKWVENAVHAVSEFFDHWKHHASHEGQSEQPSDVAETIVNIRDKLPAQVDAIKRELEESGVKMERAVLEVQDQLLTHRMRMECEEAAAAAGVWDSLHTSLAPKSEKEHGRPHLPHWLSPSHGHRDAHSH